MSAEVPKFWRSLEELADDDQFAFALAREFPEYADRLNDGPTRRQFLQLMGASLALAGVQGCVEQPQEKIVPFVRAPEQLVPGNPLYYATAITHDGAGVGLLVESQMGRPIKVEGNPLHPAVPEIMQAANEKVPDGRLRFGATDAFAQAAVLSLYDPDRSQTVLRNGRIDTWESFVAAVKTKLAEVAPGGGRGLRVLSETVVSPTLADQMRQLLEKYPEAKWHQYSPLNRDNELAGGRLALGVDVETSYHVDKADVILSLDADFLVDGPMRLQHARGFAARRRGDGRAAGELRSMNRLYVVESSTTLTGAAADHRLPLSPPAITIFAVRLASAVGLPSAAADIPVPEDWPVPQVWLETIVDDLRRARGHSLVLAGRSQPPVVHAIAHWINDALGNVGQTVEYREPAAARPELQRASLHSLVAATQAGDVQALVILGGNPVYDAPADLNFAAALSAVAFSAHLSPYDDETSARCGWHVPQAHPLESWSDTRAADGTASIIQPLIAPLHGGRTVQELLNALLSDEPVRGYDVVRAYWRRWHAETGRGGAFDAFWQTALHDGVVAGSASRARAVTIRPAAISEETARAYVQARVDLAGKRVHLAFRPDASVWDGRHANNGWLQELPRPFTKLTWDNAAHISPAAADQRQLKTGDVVEISGGAAKIEIPVFVVPGHPADVVTLFVGYGRERAGRIGNRVGTDVYPLRTSAGMWFAAGATLRKTGRTQRLAAAQHHHLMQGEHLVRAGTIAEYAANPEHPAFMAAGHEPAADSSLYPKHEYNGYKWGMAVDLSKCIGCSACIVACQAENNIPVVGKDQVARGREMHWIRIDHYYEGQSANPASYHQPVMCQHCELAPCEPVCPVAATTHSDEGLNEMTYNRCVGTRYCANNCPYKVRRFNFLEYNGELRGDAVLSLVSNPDVTVRSRGVMEKCTYCVQRINAARIEAEKEDRTILDGEVLTACQAACPSEAIVFGNLNDGASEVKLAVESPLNYSLLGELNTRPRTNYLAALRNPHPALAAVNH
ncbi:MAG: TAT-variant-translocated molybdopterin oxidoreductase [Pirellulales bacterium]